jgi:tetratricopeptide (TPR) repeat protein
MTGSLADVKSIFGKALEITTHSEREAYLQQACADNPALRAEVESLIQAKQNACNFLADARSAPGATLDEPITERPGMVIGPYKLLQQIGEGGMGTVFMAEQTQPVQRRVALKILKPGMDSRQVTGRFEAERHALALMDHPNIAKVIDAGTIDEPGCASNGRPYFVMELVKGVPITKYCDDHHLTPQQRLELFVPVCHAVQHAHQKGIIHRDLKPSNVLVAEYDDKPVAKVIDFGVVKATGPKLTEQTLFTEFGQIVGTLEYMSPEQAKLNALDIDTRSDIYALGVLLYELLTGTTPFDKKRLHSAALDEVLRIIREEEPTKPSTKLSTAEGLPTLAANRGMEPAKLSKLLRGELDWIVMKCLEKDRNRRYETANSFAMDLQRYLADEPVLACPPSAWYRIGKFARRNRVALVMASVVMVAMMLVVVAVAGSIGWAARDRALRDAVLDEQVNRTLEEANTLIESGKWSEALGLVDRADKLLASAGRMERPPRLLKLQKDLSMAERLEEIYGEPKWTLKGSISSEHGTGHQHQAEPASDEDFYQGRKQDTRFAQAFQEFGIDVEALPPTEAAARMGQTSIRPALVRALDEWADMRKRARGEDDPFWKKLVEVAQLADPDEWRNRFRDALLRRDRPALEKLADSVPIREVPPATASLLGVALNDLGALDKAMTVLREAHRHHPEDFWLNVILGWFVKDKLHPPRYEDSLRYLTAAVVLRPRSPRAHCDLAFVLEQKGDHDEAVAEFTKAVEVAPENAVVWNVRGSFYRNLHQHEKALADYSRAIKLKPDLAEAWWDRSNSYRDLNQYDNALADANMAVKLDPKNCNSWHSRGHAYEDLGQTDKALKDFSEAVRLEPKNAWHWRCRGQAYDIAKQFEKAVDDLNKAIELDPKNASGVHRRGLAYQHLGQADKALEDFSQAIKLEGKNAEHWLFRCELYRQIHQYDNALADANKAIELDPKNATARNNRGCAYLELHQYGKALDDFNKAIELDPKKPVWNNRGSAYSHLHQYDKAIADLNKAIEVDQKNAVAWINRGSVYAELGQHENAVADFSRAIKLDPKYTVAWISRGYAYSQLHRYGKALADLNKATELAPEDPQMHISLGFVYAQLEEWQKAAAAFEHATTLKPNTPLASYHLALVELQRGDQTGYRKVCSRMCERFDESANTEAAFWTAWTCVLSPDAVVDWTKPLKIAQKAHAADEKSYDTINNLGAMLYRAGRFTEAAQRLSEAEAAFSQVPSKRMPIIYNWLFQAMAHDRLGHAEEAASWLKKAVQEIDKPSPKTGQDPAPISWNRRLTVQLLRREAEELLAKKK